LLDFASDTEFLFEALTFSLSFHQPRVIQDAGGFDGDCVQDLAIEPRKCSRASRIEIQNTQELTMFGSDQGLCRTAANESVQWDHHHGPEPLENNALSCLQIQIVAVEIFGDDTGLPLDS